jgi:hypothetical protein
MLLVSFSVNVAVGVLDNPDLTQGRQALRIACGVATECEA